MRPGGAGRDPRKVRALSQAVATQGQLLDEPTIIQTLEPLRGTRDHVGTLFETTSTAQELVDTITGN